IACVTGKERVPLQKAHPEAVIATLGVKGGGKEGVLFDALADPAFCAALLHSFGRRKIIHGELGGVAPYVTKVFRPVPAGRAEPTLVKGEQSNTTVLFGTRYVMKFFRRLHEGVSPDLEIGRYLMQHGYANCPPLAGALEYHQ